MHTLDAKAKSIAGFYFICIIFLANNWQTYAVLMLFTLATILLTRIPLRIFIKGLRPLMGLILFTVLFQVLFVRSGTIHFQWGPFTISHGGLVNGVFIFFRFLLMVVMTTVITLTTKPIDLMDAVEFLLGPLKVLKVPVQDIALMLSIALRFVPILMDEALRVMNAQRARGVEFGEGNIFQQMKSVVPVFLPLFIHSFHRAEELANAMDARCYQGGEGRTKLKVQKWHMRDTLFFIIYMLLTGLLVLLRT